MVPLPTLDALDGLTIPTACPVLWDSMRGDHRTRFCDQCKQSVHDVSELTRAEVLRLVAAGRSDKEIATALGISRNTASKHVAALRAKLAAPSRTGAVTTAREAGLLR